MMMGAALRAVIWAKADWTYEGQWLGEERRGERDLKTRLRVERVASHDHDDGHVLIDESKGAVLEFTSKDTLSEVT